MLDSLEKEIEIYKKMNEETNVNQNLKDKLKEIAELRSQLLKTIVLSESQVFSNEKPFIGSDVRNSFESFILDDIDNADNPTGKPFLMDDKNYYFELIVN